MKKTIFGFTIAILIAFVGVGMIAEEARPGDFLYGFKTNINEKIAGLLVMTYTARVDHEVDLLEARLEEINALVAAGEMTPEAALIAREAIITQLEKTSSIFNAADNRTLSEAAKKRISNSLSRLQVALQSYRNSLTILEEKATEAETASAGPKRGNGSSRKIAAVVADVVETIEETVSEILEETTDEVVDQSETDTATSTEEIADANDSDTEEIMGSDETESNNETGEEGEVNDFDENQTEETPDSTNDTLETDSSVNTDSETSN